MPHFYVPAKNLKGNSFLFDVGESRHLATVLKKKSGDIVEIFDGEGSVHSARVLDCSDPERVRGEIIGSPQKEKAIQGPVLSVYPAIVRSPRFEWMIEKLTELGAGSVHPILTERTLVKIQPGRIDSKIERWKKIALAAAKQSGRKDIPGIFPPLEFTAALRQIDKGGLNLILWEGEEKTTLSGKLRVSLTGSSVVRLFVGPEGGFSLREAAWAKEAGAVSVRLGETILRAETASVAAASLILL